MRNNSALRRLAAPEELAKAIVFAVNPCGTLS